MEEKVMKKPAAVANAHLVNILSGRFRESQRQSK